MYQLSRNTFALLIVDVDEPSLRICATVNCSAYIRAPHAKTCLDKSKYKKKQKLLISCTVAHACFPLLKKYISIFSFYTQNAMYMYLARAIRLGVYLDQTLKIGRGSSVIMHQSFVSTAPSGPGISEAFNFSIFKAPLKALHSGTKIMVKSLPKAPPSRGLTIMKNSK